MQHALFQPIPYPARTGQDPARRFQSRLRRYGSCWCDPPGRCPFPQYRTNGTGNPSPTMENVGRRSPRSPKRTTACTHDLVPRGSNGCRFSVRRWEVPTAGQCTVPIHRVIPQKRRGVPGGEFANIFPEKYWQICMGRAALIAGAINSAPPHK